MRGLRPRLALRLSGGLDARRSAELARAAEEAALATVWFAENPFQRGVLPALAACALATRRIGLGIGIFNPFNRHPTLMAMETAALDELAEGRVILGIGSGIGARVRQMGLAYDRPVGAVRDAVVIARRLLAGDEVTYAGKVFSVQGARLEAPPRRADLPIYVAAMGDQALRLAGEVADGVMVSNGCAPGYTGRAVGLVREAAQAAGRPLPPAVVQYVPCALDEDGAAARDAARAFVGAMLLHYWRLGGDAPAVRAAHLEHTGIEPGDFAKAMERLAAGEPAARALDDRFLRAYALAGTAEECLEQTAAYGAAGVTELGLTFIGDDPGRAIARLGRAARP
jgi:5,10-methylenetetrahydromethanopterin reductase